MNLYLFTGLSHKAVASVGYRAWHTISIQCRHLWGLLTHLLLVSSLAMYRPVDNSLQQLKCPLSYRTFKAGCYSPVLPSFCLYPHLLIPPAFQNQDILTLNLPLPLKPVSHFGKGSATKTLHHVQCLPLKTAPCLQIVDQRLQVHLQSLFQVSWLSSSS